VTQLLLKELLPLDFENFLKMTVSVHFLSDGLMNSNYIRYTEMYHEGMQVKFKYGCGPIIIEGSCIFIHLQLLHLMLYICQFTEFY
jgi:hypothetical protein